MLVSYESNILMSESLIPTFQLAAGPCLINKTDLSLSLHSTQSKSWRTTMLTRHSLTTSLLDYPPAWRSFPEFRMFGNNLYCENDFH